MFFLTFLRLLVGTVLVIASISVAFADEAQHIGHIANNITNTFENIGSLAIAIAYLAGISFAISAIFKFKQHKDNPTQIPLGVPMTMLAIGISLVFLPSLFAPAGRTLLGDQYREDLAGGFKGIGASSLPGSAPR